MSQGTSENRPSPSGQRRMKFPVNTIVPLPYPGSVIDSNRRSSFSVGQDDCQRYASFGCFGQRGVNHVAEANPSGKEASCKGAVKDGERSGPAATQDRRFPAQQPW